MAAEKQNMRHAGEKRTETGKGRFFFEGNGPLPRLPKARQRSKIKAK